MFGTDIFSGLHSLLIIQLMGHKTGLEGTATIIRIEKRNARLPKTHFTWDYSERYNRQKGSMSLVGGCLRKVPGIHHGCTNPWTVLHVRKNAYCKRQVSTLRDSTQNVAVSRRKAKKHRGRTFK